MKRHDKARRDFLLKASGAAGAAWISTQWPAILAAADHAHQAVKSPTPGRFEVLTAEEARQVEAISAQIIPSDETAGAREAGVVYFIDRALKTFASASKPIYEKGIAELNEMASTNYPGTKSFADATAEQQLELLKELTGDGATSRSRRTLGPQEAQAFFQTIQMHTVFGYLADPSAGGNRDYAGWKTIGRDPDFTFSPPFGYYDRNYPGWQAKPETEKK